MATPYTGDVIAAGMGIADAVVVLFTPDDLGCVHPDLQHPGDSRDELELTGQARLNVVFEAGMAMARDRGRVVLVEIGHVRPISDTAGLNVVRFTDSFSSRRQLAARLRSAGLDVDTDNDDWSTAGAFTWPDESAAPAQTAGANPARSLVEPERATRPRSAAYKKFWERFLRRLASETAEWTRTRKASADNWFPLPTGMSGIAYNCSFGRNGLCSEIYFEDPDPAINEARFNAARAKREMLEKAYGSQLTFEPLPGRKGCRIADYHPGDIEQSDEWETYIDWLYSAHARLRDAIATAGGLRALVAT